MVKFNEIQNKDFRSDKAKEARIFIMDLLNDDFNVTEVLKKNGFEFNKKIEKDIDDKTNEVVYKQSNNI